MSGTCSSDKRLSIKFLHPFERNNETLIFGGGCRGCGGGGGWRREEGDHDRGGGDGGEAVVVLLAAMVFLPYGGGGGGGGWQRPSRFHSIPWLHQPPALQHHHRLPPIIHSFH
ncbi:hypothetical protein L1987_43911 [Smallanthus sonchifolius]|uniref:Uncharacterized protein n=1 Tax=Smallanthus sonchifolius TaxID=185202 RepID=A0ACB9GNM7_9ASTR|nr:hypothetical protein L1987_43911 [Smallanthus sonchifolius]